MSKIPEGIVQPVENSVAEFIENEHFTIPEAQVAFYKSAYNTTLLSSYGVYCAVSIPNSIV
jgi:hypothetical protein